MRGVVTVVVGLCLWMTMGLKGGAEGDERAPYPQAVELRVRVESTEVVAFQPLIVRVDLVNGDAQPVTVRVGPDGRLPLHIECLLAREGNEYATYEQRLSHANPGRREVSLARGESTGGETLVLFGGAPTGFAFAQPGAYRVRFAWRPDEQFAPVHSREVRVQVAGDDGVNRAFLDELGLLAREHFGWDPNSMKKAYGDDFPDCIGAEEVLREVIKHTRPLLIDPERDPADKERAELVKSLEGVLERHPGSAYAGYIARYLGLVYIEMLRHEGSRMRWDEREPERARVHPAYAKALQYLTVAKNAEVWPRTAAPTNLVRLHVFGQEWDKAEGCLAILRERCADIGGVTIADELDAEMQSFRAKIEARKAKESPAP